MMKSMYEINSRFYYGIQVITYPRFNNKHVCTTEHKTIKCNFINQRLSEVYCKFPASNLKRYLRSTHKRESVFCKLMIMRLLRDYSGPQREVRLHEFCKIECGGGSNSYGCHACQKCTVAALLLVGHQCNTACTQPLHSTTGNFLNAYIQYYVQQVQPNIDTYLTLTLKFVHKLRRHGVSIIINTNQVNYLLMTMSDFRL